MTDSSPGRRLPEAWRSASLFGQGIGNVVVARFKASGDAELGVFLLDVFCLGVKNAFFVRIGAMEYADTLKRIFPEVEPAVAMTPTCARRLVEEGVAYAGRLGIAPHEDYKLGCRVFGGIDASPCAETFIFGQNGKPFYIQGPHDSPRIVKQVLQSLEATCGNGNYHFLVLG